MTEPATVPPVGEPDPYDIDGQAFGAHLKSLRRARGLTQDVLADRSGLSADTIRRLERATFSPSLNTLTRVSHGLRLRLTTIFESLELGELPVEQEVLEMLVGRSEDELRLALRVLEAVFSLKR